MTSSATIAFGALLEAVENLDPICLLSHLTLRYLFVPADEFQSEAADIHRHQTWIELLTGLLATRPFPRQCKSKGLTHDARVGFNAQRLIADVRKAVADAFEQGIGARSYMTREPESIILHRGYEIHVPREAVTGFYLLTVTPLPLQFFTTRLANNASIADLFGGNEFPWAVSLPDLDAITEVLPSPGRFLNYAGQRIAMERAPFRIQGDEMDMLGVYLSAGLRMDDSDYAGAHVVCFAGMSTGVDEYVWKRHDRKMATESPSQFSPPGFAELIRDIEQSGCLDATDCAIVLLDCGGKARVNLMEAIREAKEKCRQTGKLHRAAIVMKNGSVGMSLVALDSKGNRDNFQRQFEAHSTLLKHAARCDTWVGMAWDLGSPRNIDLCLFLSEEWQPNSTLEQLAAQHGLSNRLASSGP